MLGVRYGDGDFPISKYGHHGLRVNDKDFAEEFARCLNKVMCRTYDHPYKVNPYKKRFQVLCGSVILHDFYGLSLEDHSEWIEPDYPAEFIRGFMDSDGCARERSILTEVTNKDILFYISSLLELYFDIISSVGTLPSRIKYVGKILGYIDGRPVIPRKVKHYLGIYGLDDIENFYWNIGFSISRKNKTLERGLYE